MKEFRKVPIHRSLTRQQFLAGCDRDLFFLLAMFCGLLLMSGLMSMYWRNVILAIVLWVIGIPILAKLAIYDAHFKGIVFRSIRYLAPLFFIFFGMCLGDAGYALVMLGVIGWLFKKYRRIPSSVKDFVTLFAFFDFSKKFH